MNEIKLYNGDCITIMDQLISDGVKVDAIITDPPYGSTACSWDSIIPFNEMWNCVKKIVSAADVWYNIVANKVETKADFRLLRCKKFCFLVVEISSANL